ncbi:MAG: CRISPR-associated endoribonuclease Cas6 [Candidatus Diapherotrites archaeon]
MRLLCKLKARCSFDYSAIEPHKTQGFIYNQLLGTPFENLHDKKSYKFFCFSNFFKPNKNKQKRDFPKTINQEDELQWIISSPNEELITIIEKKIKSLNDFSIGDVNFEISSVKSIKVKLPQKLKLITATPIVMRIPQYAYSNYGITSNLPYLYWRPEVDFNAFIKQLEENLIKKYEEYNGTKVEEKRIFEFFYFKKQTISEIVENGKTIPLHGSVWEFEFTTLTKNQKQILEFGIDAGFGERNTLGFGFINVVR